MKRIKLLTIASILLLISCSSYTGSIRGKIFVKLLPFRMNMIKMEILELNKFTQVNDDSTFLFTGVKPGKYTIRLHYRQTTMVVACVKVANDSVTACDVEVPVFHLHPRGSGAGAPPTTTRGGESVTLSEGVLSEGPEGSDDMGPAFFRDTEEYDLINEAGFFDVLEKPLSTFSADVDGASYANTRRFIMQDRLPYKDAVRLEEFINYFPYDYKPPSDGLPLSVNAEFSACPWNLEHQLVHIGIRGKTLTKAEQKSSNLVFLVDVSGSMSDYKKLPLLKQAFKMLVSELNPDDRVAIVTYAGVVNLVLPATPGSEKETILNAINQLNAEGGTAGGAAINMAYEIAMKNFIKGGNNRVILATDGDFNLGISSTSELVRFIETRRDQGVFLTVLGFGMGNYKDSRLQELADRGNGTHACIDNILEAKKVLVHEITSTLFTIAKDVKIQVEFNPARIASYRLLGYENRKLENKDFKNDKKDAGEIGPGHTVSALYEVIPATSQEATGHYGLKYLETRINEMARTSDDILTVYIRYKDPDGDRSKIISDVLQGSPVKLDDSSDNFRFSAAVAEFALLLRDSEFKGNSSYTTVKSLAKSAMGKDPYGYRAEFINLVERVEVLKENENHASR